MSFDKNTMIDIDIFIEFVIYSHHFNILNILKIIIM